MDLLEAVSATYSTIGQQMSDIAIRMIVKDLEEYPLNDVLYSLSQLRKKGGKIAFVDILEHLPGAHPGAEQAWGIVSRCLADQDVSIVWTDQMAEAYGEIRHMTKDYNAARAAFREIYMRLVAKAREHGEAPQWRASLGHDPHAREAVLLDAVQKGRLSADYALRLVVQGGNAEQMLHRLLGERKLLG